jgi:hypothetical protein
MFNLHKLRVWTGFIWLNTEFYSSSCEHHSEPFGSIKGEEFFGQRSSYGLLKKDLVRQSANWKGSWGYIDL